MSDKLIIPGDALTFMYSFMPISEQKRTATYISNIKANFPDETTQIDVVTETFTGLAISCIAKDIADHVARGERAAAAAMLAVHPELALEGTEVTGYISLPAFVNTAFKCAAWARDHQTLWMIIDKITAIPDTAKKAELVIELLKQFSEIPERFSLKPLIKAYKNYLDKDIDARMARHCRFANADANAAWLAVGVEQSKLPVNYAQHYCAENSRLYMRRMSDDKLNSRTAPCSEVLDFNHRSIPRKVLQHWYTNTAGLGVNFAICRGRSHCNASSRVYNENYPISLSIILSDLESIEALDMERTMEIFEINSYLIKLQLYLAASITVAPSLVKTQSPLKANITVKTKSERCCSIS